MKNGLLSLRSVVFLIAALPAIASEVQASDAAFDVWAEGLAAQAMRADPEAATRAQYFSGDEQDALDRRLTPITEAYRAEQVAFARRTLEELAGIDREKLDAQQRVSARLIEWHMQDLVRGEPFEDYRFVFNQFRGLHVRLVQFLTQIHPVRNRRDAENYLARLGEFAGQVDEGIAQARDAAERGFLMPDFITRSAIGQFDRFLSDEPAENTLVTSLGERAAGVAGLAAADREKLVATAEEIVRDEILPAFQRARALLQEQLPRTGPDAGLWRLPRGEEAYAFDLGHSTTTKLDAREVHETGLREVARVEAEMDGLLRQLGYSEGSVQARFAKLNEDLQPPAEPDPRPMLLARYEEILADSLERAQEYFDLQPKARCVVQREPVFTEKTAAAHYTTPARDGSRPGIFWAPLPGPEFRMVNMRTLTYHEAIPGHHFQLALMQELPGLPRFRQDAIFGRNSANAEGWALYAEQLAAEAGWYEGDLAGRIGQLEAELFRARRLVVDTGIHAMRWTRQQAIDYGMPVAEVERYVVTPGQACSYKIGHLKILELRERAKKELGERFEIREFHNTLLRAGNVPLPLLESIVDDWIAAARPDRRGRRGQRGAVASEESHRLRGAYGPYRENNDLLYYHLDVRVDPEKKTVAGKNTIRFKMLKDGTRIQIDLREILHVDKILFDAKELMYERQADSVFINFPLTLKKGETYSIEFHYSGAPTPIGRFGGFVFQQDPAGRPWVFTACEEEGACMWWPCKDQWKDEVESMDISVSVPNGLTDASNGRFVGKTDLGDGYTRWDWHVSYPINSYCVSLNIGAYVHFADNVGDLTMDFYVLPEDVHKAKAQFVQARGMLEAFQHYFGEYPFKRDGYKLIQVPYTGMEHQSAVTYGNGFQNGFVGRGRGVGLTFDFIIIHESGHEWFGNAVSAADRADMWIHEGWTNYLESLYVEYHFGRDEALRYVNNGKDRVGNRRPVIGPRDVYATPPGDQYKKGALFLNTLRSVIDDDATWWKLQRDFFQKFKYCNIMTEDVAQFFNEQTGLNLTPIFNQYLRHADVPVLQLKFNEAGGSVAYRWQASERDFAMPIKVGKPEAWQVITPTSEWQTLTTPITKDEFEVATDLYYVMVDEL